MISQKKLAYYREAFRAGTHHFFICDKLGPGRRILFVCFAPKETIQQFRQAVAKTSLGCTIFRLTAQVSLTFLSQASEKYLKSLKRYRRTRQEKVSREPGAALGVAEISISSALVR